MTAARMSTGSLTTWGLDSVYAVGYEGGQVPPHHGSESHYRDDGCPDLGIPTCLSCPLPACRYSLPPKRAGAIIRERTVAAMTAAGMSLTAIAAATGWSRRTVIRLRVGGRTEEQAP